MCNMVERGHYQEPPAVSCTLLRLEKSLPKTGSSPRFELADNHSALFCYLEIISFAASREKGCVPGSLVYVFGAQAPSHDPHQMAVPTDDSSFHIVFVLLTFMSLLCLEV